MFGPLGLVPSVTTDSLFIPEGIELFWAVQYLETPQRVFPGTDPRKWKGRVWCASGCVCLLAGPSWALCQHGFRAPEAGNEMLAVSAGKGLSVLQDVFSISYQRWLGSGIGILSAWA